MKSLKNRSLVTILLTVIWCILNENFLPVTLLTGVIVSGLTLYVMKFIQPSDKKEYHYNLSLFGIFRFFFLLVKSIYHAAFETILHLLKDEINPQFVVTQTRLERPWLQAIIGNAVTMTPGTVTIHMADGEYTILWLYPLTVRQKALKKYLIEDFEKALMEEDQHA